jgi:hypothetical protein
LEVVDENLLQILLGVNGVFVETLELGEWCRLQCHQEVNNLGGVGAA